MQMVLSGSSRSVTLWASIRGSASSGSMNCCCVNFLKQGFLSSRGETKMKTVAILAVAGVAAAATAQSISIDVANPTLNPGESTSVTLSAGYGGSDYAVAGIGTDFISSVGSEGWSDLALVAPMNGPGT